MTNDELTIAVGERVLGYQRCESCLVGDNDLHWHPCDAGCLIDPPRLDGYGVLAVIAAMDERGYELRLTNYGSAWVAVFTVKPWLSLVRASGEAPGETLPLAVFRAALAVVGGAK